MFAILFLMFAILFPIYVLNVCYLVSNVCYLSYCMLIFLIYAFFPNLAFFKFLLIFFLFAIISAIIFSDLFNKNFKINTHFRLYNIIAFFQFHLLSPCVLFVLMYAILFPMYAFCLNVSFFFSSMYALLCLSLYAFYLNICFLS